MTPHIWQSVHHKPVWRLSLVPVVVIHWRAALPCTGAVHVAAYTCIDFTVYLLDLRVFRLWNPEWSYVFLVGCSRCVQSWDWHCSEHVHWGSGDGLSFGLEVRGCVLSLLAGWVDFMCSLVCIQMLDISLWTTYLLIVSSLVASSTDCIFGWALRLGVWRTCATAVARLSSLLEWSLGTLVVWLSIAGEWAALMSQSVYFCWWCGDSLFEVRAQCFDLSAL